MIAISKETSFLIERMWHVTDWQSRIPTWTRSSLQLYNMGCVDAHSNHSFSYQYVIPLAPYLPYHRISPGNFMHDLSFDFSCYDTDGTLSLQLERVTSSAIAAVFLLRVVNIRINAACLIICNLNSDYTVTVACSARPWGSRQFNHSTSHNISCHLWRWFAFPSVPTPLTKSDQHILISDKKNPWIKCVVCLSWKCILMLFSFFATAVDLADENLQMSANPNSWNSAQLDLDDRIRAICEILFTMGIESCLINCFLYLKKFGWHAQVPT